jgi:hypothetical protein
MYQVTCASCAANFEYNLEDYIHLCPFCNSGFIIDYEEGAKELIGDHFIIPNRMDKDSIEKMFKKWMMEKYHRPERVEQEFKVLGSYGVCLPFWIVSLEAHTFWSGHSQKANAYPGQSPEYGSKFLKEEGKFSRRYRWSILARKSPKEHWGMERMHHPRESVMVDWDGFPLDESMGQAPEGVPPIYEGKESFRFDQSNGVNVAGIQIKESSAIARAKDQVQEYHRRICKTKVGTLYEHRTEIEIVGIHVVHVPFWVLRYAFVPKSVFRFLTTARERRMVISGYTEKILEAELPLNASDKVMTNLIVSGSLALISLALSIFVNPLLFFVFVVLSLVCILSAWKIFGREKPDADLGHGSENPEPVR